MRRSLLVLILGGCAVDSGLVQRGFDVAGPIDTGSESVEPDTQVDVPDDVGLGAIAGLLCAASDGVPLAGVTVWVEHSWGEAVTVTDAGGEFLLEAVPEGEWVLRAVRGAFSLVVEVRVVAGDVTVLAVDECVEDDPEVLYANTATHLFLVDDVAFEPVVIGGFRAEGIAIGGVTDLAVRPDGGLVAVTLDGALYEVDPLTARSELLCAPAEAYANALVFDAEGNLFSAGGDTVLRWRLESCEAEVVAVFDASSSGDLAVLPGGDLAWTVVGGLEGDRLVRVDVAAGTAREIGALGARSVFALAFHEGVLLGLTDGGDVLAIDVETATVAVVGNNATPWWGAGDRPASD